MKISLSTKRLGWRTLIINTRSMGRELFDGSWKQFFYDCVDLEISLNRKMEIIFLRLRWYGDKFELRAENNFSKIAFVRR